ncbi:MAG TPA: endonuclease MutS2 [Ktedonobacterales bacterium]|nr:endonuclease MutS2 [Ktedonobacterales bacterium]
MHSKSLTTLEYPKIIERLAGETAFSASRELALALQPTSDPDEARRRQAYTAEARKLLDLRPDAGVRGARDVRPQTRAAERGKVLAPADLLDIAATVRSAIYVNRLITRMEDDSPLLKALAVDLPQRAQLEARIAMCVSEEGGVLDSASPRLRQLRNDIRAAQQRLQERLGTLVNEFRTALQEPIVTIRSDRYVLPVRAEARGQVRGIVHDQSSSGATVFVEPLVVVEMNNKLRQLQIEEQQEVERILAELSELVGQEAPYILLAVELLAEIDLCLAKARYASLTRASAPKLNTEGRLHLRQARHPLLTGKVVPIDFWLGGDQARMVVVTGPNTGGKTVALKTVGLLSLMALAGLHVPAGDGSEIPIWQDVFADIGDEQSIEQSLSTFSSHLSRIVEILRVATPGALVLLDELGAGTDPSEGSALARAILTWLLERGVATIATTHYSELKAFAHEREGAVNASVEFDVETLSPTYRLTIGLPGRSNALAIAGRLGLPDDIITQAREFLGTAGVEMEGLLTTLAQERQVAADERYHLSMERAEAEYQRKELERMRRELEEERERIINDARARARRESEAAQAELARIRAQMRRNLTEERLEQLRTRAQKIEARNAPLPSRLKPEDADGEGEAVEAGELAVGDTVRVRSMGQQGEVVSLPNARGDVEVQIGPMRLRVAASNLERVSRRQARTGAARSSGVEPGYRAAPQLVTLPSRDDAPAPELQLDLRGWRVEDALEEVESYLNDAAMSGMATVRLLHGKGTGALRQAIREQLRHHPLVKKFASAEPRDGGDGITVVTLAG